MARNERLAALMTEAGFLDRAETVGRKRFARAVTDAASARAVQRTYTHTYVTRWLDGVSPRDEATRQAIADALSSKLGRRVEVYELGFRSDTTVSADLGLAYPERPEEGVSNVAELLLADASSTSLILEAPLYVGAWNESAMAWLVGEQRPVSTGGPSKVGESDVKRLRAMRETFDRLDSTFGGAHARSALVHYLSSQLPALLRADGTTDVREALFSSAGEATQLAAWMAYDSGLHGLAQRYFVQALGLADAANDALLGASILDAMSHQASFLGRYREAANMARAARMGAKKVATPILLSHFYIMEARALARSGDSSECDRAMGSAVDAFDQQQPGEAPEWISYFDTAELSAELAHCQRDLGRYDLAIEHASTALSSASGDYARSDFFAALVLAESHLGQGDIGEGCSVAAKALAVGEEIDSIRCRAYVDEFRGRLAPHSSSLEVREFTSIVGDSRLWKADAA